MLKIILGILLLTLPSSVFAEKGSAFSSLRSLFGDIQVDTPQPQSAKACNGGFCSIDLKSPVFPLIRTLNEDPDPSARADAAETLGDLGEESQLAVVDLIIAGVKDSDERVRTEAAAAVKKIGVNEASTEAAVTELVDLLVSAQDPAVRARAAAKLGELGLKAQTAAPELVSSSVNDLSADVRTAAGEAVKKILQSDFLF